MVFTLREYGSNWRTQTVLTKRPVKRGDVLLTAKPFCIMLDSNKIGCYCEYCFVSHRSDKVLRRCESCSGVWYCSARCQELGAQLHQRECVVFRTRPDYRPKDFARFLARIIWRLKDGGDEVTEKIDAKRSRRFKDLMSHSRELAQDPAQMKYLDSLIPDLNILVGKKYLPGRDLLVAIYGKILVNSFCLLDDHLTPIGMSLYLAPSIMDHSCTATAFVTFLGNRLVVRALRDWPNLDWDKVHISYLDVLNSRKDRKSYLQRQYYFTCDCRLCRDDTHDLLSSTIACSSPNCGAPLYIDETEEGGVDPCEACGLADHPDDLRKDYKTIAKITRHTLASLNEEHPDLIAWKEVVDMQGNILHPLNVLRARSLDSLLTATINCRGWHSAWGLAVRNQQAIKHYYGAKHPTYGLYLMKLGRIELNNMASSIALEHLREAEEIMEAGLGSNHPLVYNDLAWLMIQATEETKVEIQRSILYGDRHPPPYAQALASIKAMEAASVKLNAQVVTQGFLSRSSKASNNGSVTVNGQVSINDTASRNCHSSTHKSATQAERSTYVQSSANNRMPSHPTKNDTKTVTSRIHTNTTTHSPGLGKSSTSDNAQSNGPTQKYRCTTLTSCTSSNSAPTGSLTSPTNQSSTYIRPYIQKNTTSINNNSSTKNSSCPDRIPKRSLATSNIDNCPSSQDSTSTRISTNSSEVSTKSITSAYIRPSRRDRTSKQPSSNHNNLDISSYIRPYIQKRTSNRPSKTTGNDNASNYSRPSSEDHSSSQPLTTSTNNNTSSYNHPSSPDLTSSGPSDITNNNNNNSSSNHPSSEDHTPNKPSSSSVNDNKSICNCPSSRSTTTNNSIRSSSEDHTSIKSSNTSDDNSKSNNHLSSEDCISNEPSSSTNDNTSSCNCPHAQDVTSNRISTNANNISSSGQNHPSSEDHSTSGPSVLIPRHAHIQVLPHDPIPVHAQVTVQESSNHLHSPITARPNIVNNAHVRTQVQDSLMKHAHEPTHADSRGRS